MKKVQAWAQKIHRDIFLIDQKVFRAFDQKNQGPVHRFFLWVLFLGVGAIGGQILAQALTVSSPKMAPQGPPATGAQRGAADDLSKKIDLLGQNNPFKLGPHEGGGPPVEQAPAPKAPEVSSKQVALPCLEGPEETQLPLKFIQTIVLQNPAKSIAALAHEKKKKILRAGGVIDQKARVDYVGKNQVLLRNLSTGKCERLMAPAPSKKPGPSLSPPEIVSPEEGRKLVQAQRGPRPKVVNDQQSYAFTKTEKMRLLSDIDQILRQALAIQIKNPDGTLSFEITDIVPGSFYTQIGLQDGDVVSSINGKPIKDLSEIMNLFGRINEIDRFEIGLGRNGQFMTKKYSFE